MNDKAADNSSARLRCRALEPKSEGLFRRIPNPEREKTDATSPVSGKPDEPAHAPMTPHMGYIAAKRKGFDAAVQKTWPNDVSSANLEVA